MIIQAFSSSYGIQLLPTAFSDTCRLLLPRKLHPECLFRKRLDSLAATDTLTKLMHCFENCKSLSIEVWECFQRIQPQSLPTWTKIIMILAEPIKIAVRNHQSLNSCQQRDNTSLFEVLHDVKFGLCFDLDPQHPWAVEFCSVYLVVDRVASET